MDPITTVGMTHTGTGVFIELDIAAYGLPLSKRTMQVVFFAYIYSTSRASVVVAGAVVTPFFLLLLLHVLWGACVADISIIILMLL